MVWEQGVGGSNPLAPTITFQKSWEFSTMRTTWKPLNN